MHRPAHAWHDEKVEVCTRTWDSVDIYIKSVWVGLVYTDMPMHTHIIETFYQYVVVSKHFNKAFFSWSDGLFRC